VSEWDVGRQPDGAGKNERAYRGSITPWELSFVSTVSFRAEPRSGAAEESRAVATEGTLYRYDRDSSTARLRRSARNDNPVERSVVRTRESRCE